MPSSSSESSHNTSHPDTGETRTPEYIWGTVYERGQNPMLASEYAQAELEKIAAQLQSLALNHHDAPDAAQQAQQRSELLRLQSEYARIAFVTALSAVKNGAGEPQRSGEPRAAGWQRVQTLLQRALTVFHGTYPAALNQSTALERAKNWSGTYQPETATNSHESPVTVIAVAECLRDTFKLIEVLKELYPTENFAVLSAAIIHILTELQVTNPNSKTLLIFVMENGGYPKAKAAYDTYAAAYVDNHKPSEDTHQKIDVIVRFLGRALSAGAVPDVLNCLQRVLGIVRALPSEWPYLLRQVAKHGSPELRSFMFTRYIRKWRHEALNDTVLTAEVQKLLQVRYVSTDQQTTQQLWQVREDYDK